MFAVLHKNKNPLQRAAKASCKGFQYGDTAYTPLQMRCLRAHCIYAMRCDAMRKIRAILLVIMLSIFYAAKLAIKLEIAKLFAENF